MYTRIMVPLDASDPALAALGPARRLARVHDADVWPVTVAGRDAGGDAVAALVAAVRRSGAALDVTVLRGTEPVVELARLIREHPDALPCLATRARRPAARRLFGSVSGALVQNSEAAIVFAGPSCDASETGPISRVIVCVDGTSDDDAVLDWAVPWSRAAAVPLALLRVVYPLIDPAARVPPTEEELDSLGYVKRVAARLEVEGTRVVTVTMQHPSTPDAIVDLAVDVPGAIVAMAKPSEASVPGTIEQSSVVRVLRRCSVPVVVAGKRR